MLTRSCAEDVFNKGAFQVITATGIGIWIASFCGLVLLSHNISNVGKLVYERAYKSVAVARLVLVKDRLDRFLTAIQSCMIVAMLCWVTQLAMRFGCLIDVKSFVFFMGAFWGFVGLFCWLFWKSNPNVRAPYVVGLD